MVSIRPATPADLPAVLGLLKDSGLPWQDVTPAHLDHFLLAVEDGAIIGSAGLERHGSDALLRSLAVASTHRAGGLGTRLAQAIEQDARSSGVAALYLLTTTAAEFFARRGYLRMARADAPAALQATTEFSTLCPAQAACMYKHIT